LIDTLPWQAEQWQALVQRYNNSQLPHALLFSGPTGIGKRQFADSFAASLLCHQPSEAGQSCDQCRGCTLRLAGNHPDLVEIEPEEAGKAIKIDQIRALSDFTSLSAQFDHGYKVIILEPAENMNRAAANSLLKTLEEPTDNTVLILVTSAPQRLLPTIRSRCQAINFIAPTHTTAVNWLNSQLSGGDASKWLEITEGAPLTALQLANSESSADIEDSYRNSLDALHDLLSNDQDPVSVASQWYKADSLRALRWLSVWVMDIIRLATLNGTGVQPPYLACPGQQDKLQTMAEELQLESLHGFLAKLNEAGRLLVTTQANQQLVIEELLIRWSTLPRTST